jgi:hypothetical protein
MTPPGRENRAVPTTRFSVTVECRSCGAAYDKPATRSTVRANPGCPECGSLGWVPAVEAVTRGSASFRSAADPPRLQYEQAG